MEHLLCNQNSLLAKEIITPTIMQKYSNALFIRQSSNIIKVVPHRLQSRCVALTKRLYLLDMIYAPTVSDKTGNKTVKKP